MLIGCKLQRLLAGEGGAGSGAGTREKMVNGMDPMTLKKPEVLNILRSWVKWWESWDNNIYHIRGAEARRPLSNIHRLHTEVMHVYLEVEYEDLGNHLLMNNSVME
jgi:hypothetical protein